MEHHRSYLVETRFTFECQTGEQTISHILATNKHSNIIQSRPQVDDEANGIPSRKHTSKTTARKTVGKLSQLFFPSVFLGDCLSSASSVAPFTSTNTLAAHSHTWITFGTTIKYSIIFIQKQPECHSFCKQTSDFVVFFVCFSFSFWRFFFCWIRFEIFL